MSSRRSKKTQSLGDEQVVASLEAIEQERRSGVPISKKRVRVTALAAAAVALTAKERPLTAAEEEQLKTRLQYRLYQRNHRARRERKADELAKEIAVLREEIETLEDERATKRRQFAKKAVEEFVAVFRSTAGHAREAERRLREREADDAEWIVRQWRSMCEGFADWHIDNQGDADTIDTSEQRVVIVSCPLVLHIRASRSEWEAEFPSLEKATLEQVVASLKKAGSLAIPGFGVFFVSGDGMIRSLAVDFDLVTTLRSVLQLPIQVVARVAISSRRLRFLSTHNREVTADILQEIDECNERDSVGRDRRLSMDFLLDDFTDYGEMTVML